MAQDIHRNALQPGYQALWYRIERILGQGGFGITYLAYDSNLDRQVAIKEYLPIELAVREGDSSVHPISRNHHDNFHWGRDRFISEARTLAKFDHPNIVRVLSVFELNNTAYMVMRYERGKSLQETLAKGATLEEARIMNVLFPIIGGLGKVHAAGFIHRDIKPANIFIREDGSPVLLDFGSARQAIGQETKTLTTLVSPGYAPFEQYYSKSDRQGPWTDIYGLGATLYRAALGAAPMDAVDRSEGLLKDTKDLYVSATKAGVGRYSHRFLTAIDHALAFREEDRPQSLEDWAQEFGLPDEATVVAPVRAASESEASAPPDEKSAPFEPAANDVAESRLGDYYRRFIGPKNSDYYLDRFRDFDQRGGGRYVAWHWPAAITTCLWLLYRRLYLWAFVLYPLISITLALLVVIVISVVFFGGGDVPKPMGLAILVMVSSLAGGSYANAVYYRRAKSRIARMQASKLDAPARIEWLASRGGVSKRPVIIAVAVIAVFSVLVLVGEQEHSLPRDADISELEEQPAQDREERIERLLRLARRDYEALRLSTPAGNNALEKVREVLSLDPGNQKAKAGLRLIVEKYVELAGEAAERGELHEAEAYLQRALEIAPRSPKLQKAMKRLKHAMGVSD